MKELHKVYNETDAAYKAYCQSPTLDNWKIYIQAKHIEEQVESELSQTDLKEQEYYAIQPPEVAVGARPSAHIRAWGITDIVATVHGETPQEALTLANRIVRLMNLQRELGIVRSASNLRQRKVKPRAFSETFQEV